MSEDIMTRNGKHMLRLLKFNLELEVSPLMFMGARIYNELPLKIRKVETFTDFSANLGTHYC